MRHFLEIIFQLNMWFGDWLKLALNFRISTSNRHEVCFGNVGLLLAVAYHSR